jgi:hypothetical protein
LAAYGRAGERYCVSAKGERALEERLSSFSLRRRRELGGSAAIVF